MGEVFFFFSRKFVDRFFIFFLVEFFIEDSDFLYIWLVGDFFRLSNVGDLDFRFMVGELFLL